MSEISHIKAVGIIAEYNPFHNGHAYHIQAAKAASGADYCIVAMSGDFVQRGAPAVYDKYTRTKMALLNGADVVVEIPPLFATSSAEDFAACGVSLLDRLGIVTHLCFGSECADVTELQKIAAVLCQEPEAYSVLLKSYLKNGLSFPDARARAVKEYLSDSAASLLSSPNNILAVEYLKALQRKKSSIVPLAVKRLGNDYHDTVLAEQLPDSFHEAMGCSCQTRPVCRLSSASSIREALRSSDRQSVARLQDHVPQSVWEEMEQRTPMELNDFSALLSYRLLELAYENCDLEQFLDVSPELASRIRRQTLDFSSFEKQIEALKTKQYTYTRVSRCLLHILLHLTAGDALSRRQNGYVSCCRILGFRKEAAPLLTAMKKASSLPLITKTADAQRILTPDAFTAFRQDLFCSHIYQEAAQAKSGIFRRNEYTQSVIRL